MCVLDVMGVSSTFRLTRKSVSLPRVLPTVGLNCEDRDERQKWKSPRFD